MEGKIEVGDVFRYPNIMADLTAQAVNESSIRADDVWHAREFCQLVRKADPYHGITLPEPPAGYRLAKWGEEWTTENAKWRVASQWVRWPYGANSVKWHRDDPGHSIFAIPLDQPSPLKSWQFREVPWVAPEPKTLADVPERIRCIVIGPNGLMAVKCRIRSYSHAVLENGRAHPEPGVAADTDKFVRYLDSPSPKTLSLDDVPDGRVIKQVSVYHWRESGQWYVTEDGRTISTGSPSGLIGFTVTNTVAEFK